MRQKRLRALTGESGPSGDGIREDAFAVAVEMTRMPMVLADPSQEDCPVVFCNQAFCDLTGYAEEEVLGRNCRFLQGPETDREMVRRIAQAIAAREDVHAEILNYRKDGSHFWNALQINAVVDDKGRLRFLFASQQDVTHRKEAATRQSQRMESLGALASGIAHEFRNLMTVVVASIEQASASAANDRQEEQLKRADWGARRAGDLAAQLLAMARRQAVSEAPVDVNDVIRAFNDTLAQLVPEDVPENVRISLDLAAHPVPVRLDTAQLEQVLLNLVRNACDVMPGGGRIAVRTCTPSAAEAAELLGVQEAVEISVSDTGEGMAPEVAARATEPFFTTKDRSKGTGLGLFLALSFAEQSGGRLLIDTALGEGTTVRIVLPGQASS